MSNEAINWALEQPVSKSSSKFVLVAMANLAGPEMTCWPSYKHLTSATSLDVKTVQAGLKRLRDEGFISDTGERKGATGQVIVYRLNTPEFGGVTSAPKTTENGAVLGNSKTPVFPDNTPVFPIKDPQISHETPPKTGDGHHKDTSRTPKTPKVRADRIDLLDGVPSQLVDDYLVVRKAKRAGTLTETAVNGLKREALKARISWADAIRACCEFGWQGFNADWYAKRIGAGTATETTYQRTMRERMQEAAPEAARKDPSHAAHAADFFNAIEVPTRTVERIR